MDVNNLLGEIVEHKTFGKGVIHSIDEKYMTVEFKEKNKTSKFVYPAGFDGFLVLENIEKREEVERELKVWREESGVNQKKELWLQYEKTVQAIEERRLAAEERKIKAAQRFVERRPQNNNLQEKKTRKFN